MYIYIDLPNFLDNTKQDKIFKKKTTFVKFHIVDMFHIYHRYIFRN